MAKPYLITLLIFLAIYGKLYAQAPVVKSFSPASGPAGTVVTISGNNFNPTAVNNIVFFGGVKAAVSSGNVNSLQVVVPASTTCLPISVLNTVNKLTGYSVNSFIPTFTATHAISTSEFDPPVAFPSGIIPSWTNLIDLDQDGKLDAVVLDVNTSDVAVYRNTTSVKGVIDTNSFVRQVIYTSNYFFPITAVTGDIDGDGKPDILISFGVQSNGRTTYGFKFFHNTSTPGNISFAAPVTMATTFQPMSLSLGDIDGDGKPDVVAVTQTANINTLSVFLNSSVNGVINSTSFSNGVNLIAGTTATYLSLGDIDTDGKPDIILSNRSNNTISLLRNISSTGNVSFNSKVDFATGLTPQAVSIGDINGDGKPDIAVTNSSGNTVSVFINSSASGGFTTSTLVVKADFATSPTPVPINIADIDGDGKPDILAGNSTSGPLTILHNTTATGNMAASFDLKVNIVTSANINFAVGDIDGDGKPDMVVVNNQNLVSVFHNNPQFVPLISSVSPDQGTAGALITITGGNFNTTASKNIVYFGTEAGTVSSASATRLSVTVPAGESYGNVSVLNTDSKLTAFYNMAFVPTFTSKHALSSTDFDPYVNLVSLPNISGLNFMDLDGDGKPDMVVLDNNTISPSASVFRNISASGTISASSFAAKTDFAIGGNPSRVILQDVNGDGKPDILALNSYNGSVSYYQNKAVRGTLDATSFVKGNDLGVDGTPTDMALADIDGDGKPDLIVTNNEQSFSLSFIIKQNTSINGVTSFNNMLTYNTGQVPEHLCIGDIDGDGKPDILLANSDNTISIFQNNSLNGNIILGTKINLATSDGTVSSIKLADINGDGKPDMIVGYSPFNLKNNMVSVFLNVSAAGTITASSFAPKYDIAIGLSSIETFIADIDGDGKPDIVVNDGYDAYNSIYGDGTKNDGNLSVLLNNSTGNNISFSSKVDLITGTNNLFFLNVYDIDGDGKPDVLYSDTYSVYAIHYKPQPAAVKISPPVVTSFTPSNSFIGSNIIISGSGFSGSAASSVVYFGAAKGKVVSATSSQVTVQVPPGSTYSPLSVLNASNGLTGYSRSIFSNTFKSGGVIDTSIFKQGLLAAGSGDKAIANGDLDGDGKPDLVLSTAQGDTYGIAIYPNNSAAIESFVFKAPIYLVASEGVSDIILTDIDGDGKPDILVSYIVNNTAFNFSAFLNKSTPGNISFAPRMDIGFGITALAVGDFNGDGKIDVAGVGLEYDVAMVLINISTPGKISFAEPINFGTNGAKAVSIVDVDGDTKPDLLLANGVSNLVSVFRNTSANGGISFESNLDFATSGAALLKVGDIDGDGKPDLVTSSGRGGTQVSVLLNNSSPGKVAFQGSQAFVDGDDIRALSLGDINGDGKVDIVTVNPTSNLTSVLQNKSSAGKLAFGNKVDFITGQYPQYLTIGDLDGDGKPDMAISYDLPTTYSPISGIVILKNKIQAVPVPTISAGGPLTFAAGGNVVLTANPGTGFTYQWLINGINLTRATTPAYTATRSGSFTVSITSSGITNTSLATVVNVISVPVPTITAGGPLTFASGGSVILTAKPDTGYTYQWVKDGVNVTGATKSAYTATQSGSYTVGITLGGITNTSLATLVSAIAIPAPTITADGPLTFASGGSVVLTSSQGAGYTYQWLINGVSIAGASTPAYTVTKGGSYTVIITVNGISSTSAATVVNVTTKQMPTVTASGPLTFTAGGNVVLTANQGTGYSYQWLINGVNVAGATVSTYTATQSGSYTVGITANGITSASAAIVVNVIPIPTPTITASGPLTFTAGGNVVLTASQGTGYAYQWIMNGVKITGATASTYTATQSGSYTVDITAGGINNISAATLVNMIFVLPEANFKIFTTSATCRGSNNGFININAAQPLNYTATVIGDTTSTSYPFIDSLVVSNLSPGTYAVCITVAGQSNYKQCYDAVITQPADLSVYSTINDGDNSISLALGGGKQYNINLNNKFYTTTGSSITLPVTEGTNDLTVTTDRLCQGSFRKLFNVSGKIIPYPVPFQTTLNLNIGNTMVSNVAVEIFDVKDGGKVFTKQYVNQAGVVQLDVSGLKDGVYALHLFMDNQEKIFKVIKK